MEVLGELPAALTSQWPPNTNYFKFFSFSYNFSAALQLCRELAELGSSTPIRNNFLFELTPFILVHFCLLCCCAFSFCSISLFTLHMPSGECNLMHTLWHMCRSNFLCSIHYSSSTKDRKYLSFTEINLILVQKKLLTTGG